MPKKQLEKKHSRWADLLGPFGAKPWFDFLGSEEAIVVIISYNAPKP
jgi:hypothetical protein